MGIKVKEMIKDATNAKEMVKAKSFIHRPKPEPPMKLSETNTTRVVRVEAVTAKETSLLPITAALSEENPFLRVWMRFIIVIRAVRY